MLRVVFDTSVLLSGIASSSGASHRLLELTKEQTIHGIVSRSIVKEALTHTGKLHLTQEKVLQQIKTSFQTIPFAIEIAPGITHSKLI